MVLTRGTKCLGEVLVGGFLMGGGGGGDELVVATFCLHQLHCEPEEPAGLVADHLEVVVFAGAGQGVAPEEIHALASVEVA